MSRSRSWLLPACVWLVANASLGGCFRGAEREKSPPPGYPGGQCLGPDGTCDEGTCDPRNFCFDPTDPCEGFFCGGSDRGLCVIAEDNGPSCSCLAGYENETFALYCCPQEAALDAVCLMAQDGR